MPPSAATSQYPWPSGVAVIPTIGELSEALPMRPVVAGRPEGTDVTVRLGFPIAETVREGGDADDVGRRQHAGDDLPPRERDAGGWRPARTDQLGGERTPGAPLDEKAAPTRWSVRSSRTKLNWCKMMSR